MNITEIPVKKTTKHFVKLPLSTCLGGKTHFIDLHVEFYHDEITGNYTAGDVYGVSNGTTYDFNYIRQSHGEELFKLIVGNKESWDNEDIWYRCTNAARLLMLVS